MRELNLNLWLLNIRGLNKSKLEELYNVINLREYDIVCLTETHEKYSKVQVPECYNYVTRRRELGDKKGGGLMIQLGKGILYKLNVTNSPDILYVDVEIRNRVIKIVLLYMDVSNEERNINIRSELNKILDQCNENENMIVLGDFNGHIGFIGPQDLNRNGKYLLDIMERFNLILLNGDDRCQGEITREENGNKSAIDFILVNNHMYNKFKWMEIDENKSLFDLSDHCLMKVNVELNVAKSGKAEKGEIVEYYDTRDTNKEDFLTEFLTSAHGKHLDMESFDDLLGVCADKMLKKKYIKKIKKDNKPEAKWFTEEMRNSIKKRKYYNRLVRNAVNDHEKTEYKRLYYDQKAKTSALIKTGISNYEISITNKIKERNNKEIWKDINKLRRREVDKKDTILYDNEGKQVEEHKVGELLCDFWKTIYQLRDNEIYLEWNVGRRSQYIRELEEQKIRVEFGVPAHIREQFRALRGLGTNRTQVDESAINYIDAPIVLREHLDMVGRPNMEEYIRPMAKIEFTKEHISTHIKKIKTGKQPGPDMLKPELYKWMNSNEQCLALLTGCMNQILDEGEPPEKWRKSKTTLIPKKSKPKKHELRPIALTNLSYKIFMGVCKQALVDHLEKNNQISNFQTGFTKGRRLEDNILILKYCLSESNRSKTPLILTAIDFSKAFDSIDRKKLIINMQNYKCDPYLIDVIARLYTGDTTDLYFNNRNLGEIEVRSGIRQGCTGSPWLFVMAVNQIIDRILTTKIGFRTDEHYIPALFYADDGILLTKNIKDTVKLIRTLETAAREIGLEINRNKCNILIFNMNEMPEEIENIEVTEEIRYLGVVINNTKDCFKTYRSDKTNFAYKMANLTYSVIARSCNRLLIGKTYWKSVVLPSVLYASSVVTWDKGGLRTLQRIENNVWRHILGCPGYTPICAMRGDIGSSTMSIRVMKSKLKYIRYVVSEGNELLKGIFLDMYYRGRDPLIREIKGYLEELGIANLEQLVSLDEKDLMNLIRSYDSNKWLEELNEKSTLSVYKMFKSSIQQEGFYDNTFESLLLFRGRSNTLKLNWRRRFEGGDTHCELCTSGAEETLEHFMVQCSGLNDVRRKFGVENHNIEDLLKFSDILTIGLVKQYIGEMWKARSIRIG